jgi:hypothetical protein
MHMGLTLDMRLGCTTLLYFQFMAGWVSINRHLSPASLAILPEYLVKMVGITVG